MGQSLYLNTFVIPMETSYKCFGCVVLEELCEFITTTKNMDEGMKDWTNEKYINLVYNFKTVFVQKDNT